MRFDVLVIGAGPAGAAAARRAASRGLSVALVDRADFPRDKVCGDALIPDALSALAELGMSSILAAGSRSAGLRVFAPDGTGVALAAESVCVPRRELDEALRTGAVEAGATFLPRHTLEAPLVNGEAVTGARFVQTGTGARVELRARATVLATGGSAGPLECFGVCRRSTPSATAGRIYVEVDPATSAGLTDLLISYDAAICPGYGWIFPGPRHTFNVGVGFFYDSRRRPNPANLRILLDRFLGTFPPAAALMRGARSISPLRGAPLRTAMTGADLARPGLLVAGDAAGLTYSLTGEGIGKAMQSGILAADVIAANPGDSHGAATRIAAAYAVELTARFGARFRAYRTAQGWVTSHAVGNLLARRANRGRFVRQQLEALIAENGDPRALFSLGGLARALWR
ncbi:MAG TPA: geranylgeranyl reductase family protein [Vicinamibacterales bacterium]|nr:geranylgeranyl reductase family protein [Vicinamibacterales bacterium]